MATRDTSPCHLGHDPGTCTDDDTAPVSPRAGTAAGATGCAPFTTTRRRASQSTPATCIGSSGTAAPNATLATSGPRCSTWASMRVASAGTDCPSGRFSRVCESPVTIRLWSPPPSAGTPSATCPVTSAATCSRCASRPFSLKVEHGRLFTDLRAIVVDEVHAFAGDDRGWHLLAVLERLTTVAGRPIQRIGLSATVGNPADLLDWLQGSGRDDRSAVVVSPDVAAAPAHDGDAAAGVFWEERRPRLETSSWTMWGR